MVSDVLSFALASGVAERALPQRKTWLTRAGQMRGRSSTGVEVSRRQTTRSSGGTDILDPSPCWRVRLNIDRLSRGKLNAGELVVKLFAEISSSTSAATFANRELPNWVDGKKERVAVKLNLQSSANLSPFDNRSSRFQLCLSTELSIFMCSKFFFTGSDPPSRHLNLVHP